MPKTDDSATCASVRAELARYSVTQGEVAELLSLSRTAIGRRMRGETAFRDYELQRIAKRLGISVSALMGDHESAVGA